MFNSFTAPIQESKTIKDFLSQEKVDEILKSYYSAAEIFSAHFGQSLRITEIGIDKGQATWFKMCDKVDNNTWFDVYSSDMTEPIKKIEETNLFSWTKTIVQELENLFEQNNMPAKIYTMHVHNLHSGFDIHTDGADLVEKKKKRPASFPYYDPKNYHLTSSEDFAHQGLITLSNNGTNNGTIIFDQWFPVSTYIEQHKPYDEIFSKKANIRFYKDEPMERFGENVRNYTNQPMPESDYQAILEIVKDPNLFSREQAFGLTLDKILFFGPPGSLNVWAEKKYHMPIPYHKNNWPEDRIMLQYESIYKK